MADEGNSQPGAQFTPGQQFQPQQSVPPASSTPHTDLTPGAEIQIVQPSIAPLPAVTLQPAPPTPVQVQSATPINESSTATQAVTPAYSQQIAQAELPPSPYQNQPFEANDDIAWTASEYIAYDKSSSWYTLLATVAVILSVMIYFITGRSIISGLVPLVGAMVFAVYGRRPPRELEYRVADGILSVGSRDFPLDTFRSFGVVREGAFSSISFMPLKRFAPPLSIYYAPNDQDAIVAYLADYLPVEERHQDFIERLMHHLRF